MKKAFIREKIPVILGYICVIFCLTALGATIKVPYEYIVFVLFIITIVLLFVEIREYMIKQRFYQDFLSKLNTLDQKYLIIEMVEMPEFYEGRMLCDALYDIGKAMQEKINDMENSVSEFKEYIEMWIHEVKIPISNMMLMNYNKNMDMEKQKLQLMKLYYYVEQILFYARADASQKDYLLKRVSLETVVNKVVIGNKDLLIGNKFQIEKENLELIVYTDSKWLEFILGQIVNNSIKYKKGGKGYLKFFSKEEKEIIWLIVEDHGIGIEKSDIGRVFEKSFTGNNGRKVREATGMGLFICKKLCDKMGHRIWIESEKGEYTRVGVGFGKNRYYELNN